MPHPLPYFKENIYPFPLPHFASIFFAYLWSFRWPNYIATLPKYFSFRLPHLNIPIQGRIQGGARRAPSLKLETIWFFGVKSWFFTRNTPNIFAPPSARRNCFKCAPPNLKSWIHPCYRAPLRRIEQE
jgi:hypothetical protein